MRRHIPLRVFFWITVAIGTNSLALGQEKAPERGFRPSGSYALSDIETISTTSGNMILKVPLASLPPGRGGLSASLSLLYNSKLYDSFPASAYITQSYYNVTNLKSSQAGGWRYGYKYELYGEGRYGGADEVAGDINPCSFTSYIAKLSLLTPDGGKHELRLTNHTDGDGFHNVLQDGRAACAGGTPDNGTLVYYTTDGTFLRLEVEHDSDTILLNNPWTLFLPDGGRVRGGNIPQRIYDRNNNYIEIVNYVLPNGHSATKLQDELNRSIVIEYGAAANQDTIQVTGFNGAALTTTVTWTDVVVHKAYSRDVGTPFNLPATWRSVSQITLPSQAGSLSYSFGYNANGSNPTVGWGELNSIILPSGAKATYTFANDNQNNISVDSVLNNRPTQKQLVLRSEYDGVSVSNSPCVSPQPCITETWTYVAEYINTGDGNLPIKSTITGPDGGVTTEHFNKNEDGTYNYAGLVYKSVAPDGTLTERYWQPNTPYTNSLYVFNETYYPKYEFTSVPNASGTLTQTAIKEYNYDKNGNVTRVAAYDWVPYANVPRNGQGRPYGVPTGVIPKRITVNTYYNPTPDASNSTTYDGDSFQIAGSPRLHKLLESSEIRDGNNARFSRTEVSYDNTTTTGIVSYAIGNPTQRRFWDSTKGTFASPPLTSGNCISTSTAYDAYGNPITLTDAKGNQTQLTYGPINGYSGLYPTETRVAYGTSVQRFRSTLYDYFTGLVTRLKDEDNNVMTVTGYDDLGRPRLVQYADGKAEETNTLTEYSDANRRVIVRFDRDDVGDGKLISIKHYDQLGRIRLTRQLENATTQSPIIEADGIKVQSRYLTSGSYNYQLSSNPHRSTSDTTMGWTRTTLDKGGRIVEVQTFTGAGLPSPWGSNSTSTGTVATAYDAQFTTVTDQAGKVRRSMTNGLGQFARVDEPTTSGLGSTSSPNQATTYTYDPLANLVKVEQGSQNRYFMYDSLSRLRRARHPEQANNSNLNLSDPVTGNSQWPMAYQYDDNGNLLVKTDARDVSTHIAYDALNRPLRRWYNSSSALSATTNNSPGLPSGVGATEETDYFYDSQALHTGAPSFSRGPSMGRLVAVTYGNGSAGDYFAYDFLGRSKLKTQQTGGINYQVLRGYNRAGSVTTQTYPSGRTVGYGYDGAGRISNFSGYLGDGTQRTYASGILYSSLGGMEKEQFGTDTVVYNKSFYNSRGQLAEVRVSTSYTGPTDRNSNRGSIVNQYSLQCSAGAGSDCGGTDNNGNLMRQELLIPHDDAITSSTSWYQKFDYDELNRLQRAKEYNSSAAQLWQQEYQYDRWGNRRLHQTNTWGIGINKKDFTVNSANNRLGVPGGQSGTMGYDSAGNLTTDSYTGVGSRYYDAENRMISAQGGAQANFQYYNYDAVGQRIIRTSEGVATWQIYGLDGELLAEYLANDTVTNPRKEYGYRNGQLLVTAGPAGPTPILADDFNDNVRDITKWNLYALGPNPSPVYERNGRLEIQSQYSATNSNSGGYVTAATHNLNGKQTSVEVVQSTTANGGGGNYAGLSWGDSPYRIMMTYHYIYYDNTSFIIDPVRDRYIRLRDDPTTQTIYYESSPNGVNWEVRASRSRGAASLDYTVRLYNGNTAGWTSVDLVIFDNFRLEASGSQGSGSNIHWLVADQLGTPRMIFDKTGTLANVKRHDFLPFGEELFATQGSRTASLGYAPDTVRQKFTQKERDSETGLDYFGARYHASTQGRFTAADSWSGRAVNPQSFNLYSYVGNNPLKYIDLWGHQAELPNKKGKRGDAGDEIPSDGENPVDDGECPCPIYITPVNKEKYVPNSKEIYDDWFLVLLGRLSYGSYFRNAAAFLEKSSRDGDAEGRKAVATIEEILGQPEVELMGPMVTGPFGLLNLERSTSIRVGRWMSQLELEAMLETGFVQLSRNLKSTNVAFPASATSFLKQAEVGAVYVEFNVPRSSVVSKGGGWALIPGPDSIYGRLAAQQCRPVPQMPRATDIEQKAIKISQ